MTKKTRIYAAKPRSTLALRGTTSTPKLQLDHRSELAVEWARRWLKHGPGAMGIDPLTSGTIRRALAVYIDHLQRPDLDPTQEARAVRSACSASTTAPQDRLAAWKRLQDHEQGDPFPTFSEVLHAPHSGSQWLSDLEDRVDALVAQMTSHRKKTTA